MIFKSLIVQLKSVDYYLNLLFSFVPTLFIIQLWRYLSRFFDLGANSDRLVFYFILVYGLSPFFHFSFIKQMYAKIFQDESSYLLIPEHILKIIFDKIYWPIILGQLPLILLSVGFYWYFVGPSAFGLVYFVGLILFGLIYHFFFVMALTLIFVKTKVAQWLDFFLRQEAYLWGGAYVPLIFFPHFFQAAVFKIPFAYSAIAGLLYLGYWPTTVDLFPIAIYLLIFMVLTFWLTKKFINYVQT